jgi:hypothetical protein
VSKIFDSFFGGGGEKNVLSYLILFLDVIFGNILL